MLFTTVMALVKISTLVLYQRVFVVIRNFCLVCTAVMTLTVGWFLALIFVSLVPHMLLWTKGFGLITVVRGNYSPLRPYQRGGLSLATTISASQLFSFRWVH